MGPSGSGKSTLLTIAGGLERADHGQVVVGGEHLRARIEPRGVCSSASPRALHPG
jgi:ABC-type lipoprotein export system ATPase subunit